METIGHIISKNSGRKYLVGISYDNELCINIAEQSWITLVTAVKEKRHALSLASSIINKQETLF